MQNVYDDPNFFTGYKQLRETSSGFNEILEQPALQSLLSTIEDQAILDIGCGFGDFCRYCVKHGARSVIGIDPSRKMLEQAQEETTAPQIKYLCTGIEKAEFNNNQFDIIVSSLAFHYVKDFNSIAVKLYHWLKPNGILVFSVEHPICTSNSYSAAGEDIHGSLFPVRNYRDETLFLQNWLISGVEKYHRTTSSYMNALLNNQLSIRKVLEPMPTDEQIREQPSLAIHAIRPPLLIISAQKDTAPYIEGQRT
ncbi:class I SAM-dependent methyltransferase [Dongshaea marina]|uniref:class I SAM-dependent methyltransferase n=1 Tax=Dongshaea marina TaxID=2047966 RepID=UPI000D3EA26D|nr:class I SAM-dependent methyltransferase [Dongshaea marina]